MHPVARPCQFDTPLIGEGARAAVCNGAAITTTITTHTISPVRPVVFA